ncbi:MAG: hypothetical protein IKE61_02410 [Coriobacteriales bacterium]|nr:hypothetical protein [Coriobacteriales bacterium]
MRRYAYLKESLLRVEGEKVCKIMLCEADEGVYLFEYCSLNANRCSADRLYDSLDELYDEWNDLIDERGWIDIEDPLPDCQHDAFLPIRIKGRDIGKPEWGRFETLKDGEWVEFDPTEL